MIYFDESKAEEEQYAAFRADSSWRHWYRLLRRGYWHATNNWDAIRADGAIRPNLDRRFRSAWGVSERSFGFNNGYICLFDIGTPNEEEVIRIWDRIYTCMTSYKVLLQIDRRRLRSMIIPNNKAFPPPIGKGRVSLSIPYCEVWYPKDIPLFAITHTFEIRSERGSGYGLVPMKVDA